MHQFSKTLLLLTLAALFPIVSAPGLRAQEAPGTVFRSDTRLVVLHASVVDKGGRLMTTLQKDAFKVFEGKVEQPIKKVTREDVPVSLGLVIDNSGSMRDKRKKVETAALDMVKASNPRDEVTIINFNDEAFQDVEFTSDVKKMEEGLTRIDSRGGTAMRDAISTTIDYLKEKGKHSKKVIVVITDGDDNASSTAMTLERLVQKAQKSEVLLYMVGLLSEESKRDANRAKHALQVLADASGASASFPKELSDVDRVTIGIAGEIRSQYIIEYNPLNQNFDGGFRPVRVAVNAPGKPAVRTRTGYYATPDAPAKGTKSAQVTSR